MLSNYEITWDYEFDKDVPDFILSLILELIVELKTKLLPKLKVFSNFAVYPVKLMPKQLGVYCSNTSKSGTAIIGLDIKNHIEACKKYKVNLGTALETSILHELGHAIQDYKGKAFDEDEAEEFASDYHYFRMINKI
jgi:hypothetical protein